MAGGLFSGSFTRTRAVTGDMAFRSAGIACLAVGLRAVLGNVSRSRAVVALGALHAFAREMAYSTTSVAGFLVSASKCAISFVVIPATTTTTASSSPSASSTTTTARFALTSAGAIASDMSYLTASVAFGAATSSATATTTAGVTAATRVVISRLGAITGNMTLLIAFVARLGLGFSRAFARDMTLFSTVVASRGPRLWATSSLVTEAATVKTSTSS